MAVKWAVEISQNAEEFIKSLPQKDKVKVFVEFRILRAKGLEYLRVKNISGKLWELKIKNIRLFYFLHQSSFVILSGYLKKSQKAPEREIQQAENIMKIYLKRSINNEIQEI